MAALPYMQLYIADYLADTMHLSAEEHGAYLLLMFNYWQTGKPIPKSRLAKIARISKDRWPEVEATLSDFFEDDGHNWIHLRIERDMDLVTNGERHKKSTEEGSSPDYKGMVYFITGPDLDAVKVGYSKNPWARLSELRSNYGSVSVVATIRTVVKPKISVATILSSHKKGNGWFFKQGCINSLIEEIVAGKITTVEAISDYVDNYDSYVSPTTVATTVVTTVATTATTNKDPDKDLNPTHNARVREEPPGPDENPPPAQPEYLAGLDEPLGKFPMHADWQPSLDFRRRAALWGVHLPKPDYHQTELAAFRDYWIPEGKVFAHVQWEQKFARHVAEVRSRVKPTARAGSHAKNQPGSTESRAVQEIRTARERWEQEQGDVGERDGVEILGAHGGDILGPLDPEERLGPFGALDSPDRFDD